MAPTQPALHIKPDPWASPVGGELDAGVSALLEAVIQGDALAVQIALSQGADPLTQLCRSKDKERRTLAGLAAWHELPVAKELLEVFCSAPNLDQNKLTFAVLSSSGPPIPQALICWFLQRQANKISKFEHAQYSRRSVIY